MNTNCEDGRHALALNAWVDIVDSVPLVVTLGEPIRDTKLGRNLAADQLALAVEAYVPAWVQPITESDLVFDTETKTSAPVRLFANQPTHVRQVWWPEGTTLEGHPKHALEQIAVRVIGDVALDRNGIAVPAPRDGAQSRLIPIR